MKWEIPEKQFKKYQDGDSTVVEDLYGFLTRYVKASLRSNGIPGEIQEEIAQNILLKIHVNRDRYDSKRPLRAWVVTIIKRTVIDHWRTEKSSFHHKDMDILDDISDDKVSAQNKLEAIEYLNLLRPNEKAIVYKHIWLGEKLGEIAKSQGDTLSAVKSRFRRSLKRLAKHE